MKTRIVALCCAAVLVCAVGSGTAWGDPVVITAGTFDANVLGTVAIPVSFTSSLFDVSGVLDLGFGPKGACEPCLPGQTVTFSTVLAGPDPASGTINGTFYPAFTLEGVYNFTSPSVQLPSGLQALQTTTLTLPFSMSGTFNAFSTSPQTPILVDLPVTGQGSLTVTVEESQSNQLGVQHAIYTFSSDSPSPTPEPASLLLISSGVIGIFALRWRT